VKGNVFVARISHLGGFPGRVVGWKRAREPLAASRRIARVEAAKISS